MKLSLNWIKDYVDLPADLTMEQLAYDLTMRTVEVEGIENPADSLNGIVVGIVKSIERHPNAEKLVVCQVDAGQTDLLQIVCGGTNLYVNQKVAVSVPGALVRWHGEGEPVEIKVTELRGVKSEGMICGADELALEQMFPPESEGIILDLAQFEAKAGDPLSDVLAIDDYILEIDNKSMTNRPDLWGHYGMARELAAIYGKDLRPIPEPELPTGLESYPVAIETANCMRYSALIYEGLTVEPAPFSMQKRLWSVGVRPINNLVDLTNYVMLATGQPTHGFDRTHVPSGIVVRQAKAHEELELLDDTVLDLTTEDMLITDGPEPLALAGIMGGKKDSILPDTTGMILELASFNALAVRRTAQRHGLRTESSTRFEKNIDTARVDQAIALAHSLILELAPSARLVALGEAKGEETKPAQIELDYRFLESRIGQKLSAEDIKRLLTPLGFTIVHESDSSITVEAPVWRSTGDVSLADDLLEEIARMIGYENFTFTPPVIALEHFVNQKEISVERNLKEALAFRAGFQEIFTYPWVNEDFIQASGLDTADWLELDQPPAPEERLIRASLVPGMIESIAENLHYFTSFRIFELTQVFRKGESRPSEDGEVLPIQSRSLVAAIVGEDPVTLFREAKGVLEALPRLIQIHELGFGQVTKPSWADPKMWLSILDADGKAIGSLGLLSLRTENLSGMRNGHAVVWELDVEALVPHDSRENRYKALPTYPEVWQDLNFVVDEDTPWAELAEVLAPHVIRSRFVEEYYGKQLPEGKKSLIFRYWLGSEDKTLTAEEIEAKQQTIIAELEQKTGAKLRA